MVQSRLSVRDGSVGGCWWRPDACAAAFATPSDGAPTLVPSDGAIGRANSQPPVSRASSLSLPYALPLSHIHAHVYTGHTGSRIHTHTYTQARARACTHGHTHTHPHVHTRTHAVARARAHVHSLALSPPTSCESLHPPNDTRGSPSSWLDPHGCSAFANTHETTTSCSHARTHAHGVGETRHEDDRDVLYRGSV